MLNLKDFKPLALC